MPEVNANENDREATFLVYFRENFAHLDARTVISVTRCAALFALVIRHGNKQSTNRKQLSIPILVPKVRTLRFISGMAMRENRTSLFQFSCHSCARDVDEGAMASATTTAVGQQPFNWIFVLFIFDVKWN